MIIVLNERLSDSKCTVAVLPFFVSGIFLLGVSSALLTVYKSFAVICRYFLFVFCFGYDRLVGCHRAHPE